jgi:hypothetical protein
MKRFVFLFLFGLCVVFFFLCLVPEPSRTVRFPQSVGGRGHVASGDGVAGPSVANGCFRVTVAGEAASHHWEARWSEPGAGRGKFLSEYCAA